MSTLDDLFAREGDMASQGAVLAPLVRLYVAEGRFPRNTKINLPGGNPDRDPDDWFHPSTHPTMGARKLYYYLAQPQHWDPEPWGYEGRMSVTVGTLEHAIVQMALETIGVLVPPQGTCPCCSRFYGPGDDECGEPGVADPVLKRRGHMDGIVMTPALGMTGFDLKCLAPETSMSMADGSMKRADEISPGDLVIGWDEELDTFRPAAVRAVWDNGIQPVWTVVTREGHEVRTTDEHPFWTQRGWVFAKNLEPGDAVKVAFGSGWWRGEFGDPDRSRFLGLMVGDGGLTGGTPQFTKADPEVIDWMRSYVDGYGCHLAVVDARGITYRITHGRHGEANPITGILKEEALWGESSHTKRVPHSVFVGGPECWSAFLSGYFDADGHVANKGTYPHLSWGSVNKALLEDCQLLLSYLGIRSSLNVHRGKYKGEEHISWMLRVRDAVSVLRAQEILDLRSVKKDRLAALSPKPPKAGHHRTAQPGWDKVLSASEGLSRPTLGIEMEGGTHVTGGLVTHNTINHFSAAKIPDGPDRPETLQWLKTKHPYYFGQMQEYMALSGLRMMVMLFIGMGFPWVMKEVHVEYDPGYVVALETKYRMVREAVAAGTPPEPCCSVGSKESKSCPATGCMMRRT